MRLLATLALAAVMQATGAEQLADPTRPPPGLGMGVDQPAPPPLPLRVSSVFATGERAYAIVDGQEVRVGDPLGEGRVTRIDERGVWIRDGKGIRQLPLLPAVQKATPPIPPSKGMEK